MQPTKILSPGQLKLLAYKKHFEVQSKCRETIVPNLFYLKAICNDEKDWANLNLPWFNSKSPAKPQSLGGFTVTSILANNVGII
jgi:hypothetical protein